MANREEGVMFAERLKQLRKENKFSQEDMAIKLDISTSAYGYYEQGKTTPNAKTLNILADIFDVTTDYLLGRSYERKLTKKDETEIGRDLERMKSELMQGNLRMSLDGEEIDDEIKEFIISNMENTLILAKLKAKEKFTPKKYRK